MAKKNYTTEQIIVKIREIELYCGQGKRLPKRSGRLKSPNKPIIAGVRNTVA